jgi:hypothetical protein
VCVCAYTVARATLSCLFHELLHEQLQPSPPRVTAIAREDGGEGGVGGGGGGGRDNGGDARGERGVLAVYYR